MSVDKYVVSSTVYLQGSYITRAGFNTPMILDENTMSSGTVKTVAVDDDYANDSELSAECISLLTAIFSNASYPAQCKVGNVADITTVLTTEIDTLSAADDDWYYLLKADETAATATSADAMVAWVNVAGNQPRIAVVQDDDATGVTLDYTTDDRTISIYHDDNTELVHGSIVGFAGSLDPDNGSASWAHRTLNGIDGLHIPSSVKTILRGQDTNYYENLAGNGDFLDGVLSNGLWIDTQISADWLATRAAEDLRNLLLTYGNRNQSIPYTDAGFAIIGQLIQKRLNHGVRVGHFKEGSTYVNLPTLVSGAPNEVATSDQEDRKLVINFGAETSGAIHRVDCTIYVEAL